MKVSQIKIAAKSTESVAIEQLGEFLFLFRGAYSVALEYAKLKNLHSSARCEDVSEDFRRSLRTITPERLDLHFSGNLKKDAVVTKSIVHNSPLEIVVAGSMIALTLAAIVSGGEAETPLIKFKINKLGDGIKSLRDAFGLGGFVNAGFGVRSTKIKLNKSEYEELMKQDPQTRKNGGFQGFLVSLQGRVKRRTLELSEADVDKIIRYQNNPRKGGWQNRFKKIFQRHINLQTKN